MFKQLWEADLTNDWGYAKIATGAVITGVCYASEIASSPAFTQAIKNLSLSPELGLLFAVLGGISLLCAPHSQKETK